MHLCNQCQKPFINESSRNRHLRYCGTRKRRRQQACKHCNTAKAKCSFNMPCTRCVKKGFLCKYDIATSLPPAEISDQEVDLSIPRIDLDFDLEETFNPLEGSLKNPLGSIYELETELARIQQLSCVSWCSWMKPGFSTSIYFDEPNVIATLRSDIRTQNVDLVVQAIRCFPRMMLRKETFPWFIHRSADIPPALATCMGISQMFSMRTNETRSVIWQSVRNEQRMFGARLQDMSLQEIVPALQACMIYFIMFLVDNHHDEREALELLLTLQTLSMLWKNMAREPTLGSWEDWIIEESQTRLSTLWLLIGCVICIKTYTILDATQSYRSIPLPSSRVLWDAASDNEWQHEKKLTNTHSCLRSLGDLIDAQRLDSSEDLDNWNAGIDQSGALLNLVGSMV